MNLDALASCARLRTLHFEALDNRSFDGLGALKQVRHIKFSDYAWLRSVDMLSSCCSLRSLGVYRFGSWTTGPIGRSLRASVLALCVACGSRLQIDTGRFDIDTGDVTGDWNSSDDE